MDLKTKIKLWKQSAKAIKAWEADNKIKLQGSYNGKNWYELFKVTITNLSALYAYDFYRIVKIKNIGE